MFVYYLFLLEKGDMSWNWMFHCCGDNPYQDLIQSCPHRYAIWYMMCVCVDRRRNLCVWRLAATPTKAWYMSHDVCVCVLTGDRIPVYGGW